MVGMFVLVAAIGIGVGILSGMLGIGGGMIMVPLLRLAFGLDPLGSTGTSLFAIIPTSISGAVSHLRGGTCVPKLGLALGIGGACTSPVGVLLAQHSPAWLVMTAAALVIAYSGFTMFRKALRAQEKPLEAASSETPAQPALNLRDALVAIGIGTLAGVASGYVGLGGGFIMVPLMMSLYDMPMKLVSGTSLIAVLILATPGAVTQCVLGNVDYLAGIALACGTVPGAVIGTQLVRVVPERGLRFAFSGLLLVAAILLVVKETALV